MPDTACVFEVAGLVAGFCDLDPREVPAVMVDADVVQGDAGLVGRAAAASVEVAARIGGRAAPARPSQPGDVVQGSECDLGRPDLGTVPPAAHAVGVDVGPGTSGRCGGGSGDVRGSRQ